MSDNGSCYVAASYADALRTSSGSATSASRPYRPRTNGKAERFIQTLLNEWAYARDLRQLGRTHRHSCRAASTATTTDDHTAPSATARQPPG